MRHHNTLLGMPAELRLTICRHLEMKDLFNFSLVSKEFYPCATITMYRRDANSGNSFAILWAASASGVSVRDGRTALQTFKLSVTHKGNVNAIHVQNGAMCTALHVAAAHGHTRYVEELIDHGAAVNIYSLRLWRFLNVGKFPKTRDCATELRTFAEKKKIQNQYWLPLLPAMFRNSSHVAELLIQYNSQFYLTLDRNHLFLPPLQKHPRLSSAYTFHHILAEENMFFENQSRLFQHFSQRGTFPEPGSMMTPLMKAIDKGHELAAEILLTFPQNIDTVSRLGWPALSYAIKGASVFKTPKKRMWSADMVRLILEQGADANAGGPSSPLELAVTDIFDDKILTGNYKHCKEMKEVISCLLRHGADVNAPMSSGQALSHYVFLRTQRNSDTTLARFLFFEFLGHGMRVIDPFPDGSSMLGRSLAPGAGFQKLPITLLAQGARLADRECDDVLRRWASNDGTIPGEVGKNLHSYASVFSQDAVNAAYCKIVENNDTDRYDALSQWREHTNRQVLIAKAIRSRFSRRQKLFELPFDINWTNSKGKSYAHIIVEQLRKTIRNESDAMEDMKILIDKGISLETEDQEGYEPLQRLTEVQIALSDENAFGKLQWLMGKSLLGQLGKLKFNPSRG